MGTNHNTEFTRNSIFSSAYQYAQSNMPFEYSIRWRVHQAIWLGLSAAKRFPGLAFVELGTGRGFVMQAVLFSIEDSLGAGHIPSVYLFDSFKPFKTDGVSKQSQEFGVDIYYVGTMQETSNNFKRWSASVKLVEGILPTTLEEVAKVKISFLHIDLNASQIEAQCLEQLWDNISMGGFILLDDYANARFAKTISPVQDFLVKQNQYIFTTPSGQGIVIKS